MRHRIRTVLEDARSEPEELVGIQVDDTIVTGDASFLQKKEKVQNSHRTGRSKVQRNSG
jgi:hypothetical protein